MLEELFVEVARKLVAFSDRNPWFNWFVGHAVFPSLFLGLGLLVGAPRLLTFGAAFWYTMREPEQFLELTVNRKVSMRNALSLKDRLMDLVMPWAIHLGTVIFTSPEVIY